MNGATAQRQGGRILGEARPPIAAAHLRTDSWWVLPVTVVVVLLSFIVYSTWAAFQNAHYFADPYLSPFYSPCLTKACLHHSFGGWTLPDFTFPIIGVVSPAFLILGGHLDGRAQTGAARPDDQDVVLVGLVVHGRHQMILQSRMIPMETSRM